MKVVMTGATGFIGPTLIHEYNRSGNKVSVLTRSMMTTRTSSVSYINWDAENPGEWEKEFVGAVALIIPLASLCSMRNAIN